MGHIKEPKGVDFVIASAPLTEKARKQISEFISDYKSKATSKKSTTVKRDKVFQN